MLHIEVVKLLTGGLECGPHRALKALNAIANVHHHHAVFSHCNPCCPSDVMRSPHTAKHALRVRRCETPKEIITQTKKHAFLPSFPPAPYERAFKMGDERRKR